MSRTYLAADFGGGSGRVIAGTVRSEADGGKSLVVSEIYRFPNSCIPVGNYLYWDFPALLAALKTGLSLAAAKFSDVASVGIDTWGVDFGLVDKLGNLISNPICYRDNHTEGLVEKFSGQCDLAAHYGKIGIQILPINTLFRLMSMVETDDPRLKIADKLLFMPDLFSYYLTGRGGNEYTIASTSELLGATAREWDAELIRSIGIDPALFGEILMPGDSRGTITKEVARETGLPESVKVIAVGSHDTASAVFAAADDDAGSAFLSSGTWSLLGVTSDRPILTEEARRLGYTNEGGVGGKIRFLTNITGLWILQQLMAQWKKESGENLDWPELIAEAECAKDTCIVDVDDPIFQNPADMQGNIARYCETHRLDCPQSRGEFVRCVCVSLAARYKKAIDDLNKLLPNPVKRLKIFGGGSRNRLLTRLTAEATGLEVQTGPSEATAIGNLLVQAIADGAIQDKSEITRIIAS